MRNTTTTVVIAAGAMLAAVIVTRTPAQVERPTAGAGDPCPADIDNDGDVGINDFLQLLADWGPCPTPRVVAIESIFIHGGLFHFRLWSSGQVEIRRTETKLPNGQCWECGEAWPPAHVWVDYGVPSTPTADSRPVDTAYHSSTLYVGYSDGVLYQANPDSKETKGGCCNLLPAVWEVSP